MTSAVVTRSRPIALPWSLRALANRRELQLVAIMLSLTAICGAINPAFLSSAVISNILITGMVTVFMALGQLIVILTKGIDLSVAPILGISALVVGYQAEDHGLSLPLGVLLGIGLGAALGLGNAVLVSLIGLPPIIATLGTFSVYGGLQYLAAGGSQVYSIPSQYTQFGDATRTIVYGVPPIFLAGVLVTALVGALLRHTAVGRSIYATGDDTEAAFRAAIPTKRVLFLAYVLCGIFAGIAGVVYLVRTGSANSLTGTQTNEELNAIAAALIGGAALTGGRGTATGAALGAIFLSFTLSAMGDVANIPDVWQPAGVGALILLAIVADTRSGQGTSLKVLVTAVKRRWQL